jgi:uncharacterized protein (DUF924 family)
MESGQGIEQVLDYWFGSTPRDALKIGGRMAFWFGDDPATDTRIREQFGALVDQASTGELDAWAVTPRGRLALIILLDQFRRNIFRGAAEAFARDQEALGLTLLGMQAGQEKNLAAIEQAFFYMPMQHSESLKVQDFSVQCFNRLAESVNPSMHATFAGFRKFAELHRDIVARFGRFPHRNAILGRTNSPDEEAYLANDAPNFGQG